MAAARPRLVGVGVAVTCRPPPHDRCGRDVTASYVATRDASASGRSGQSSRRAGRAHRRRPTAPLRSATSRRPTWTVGGRRAARWAAATAVGGRSEPALGPFRRRTRGLQAGQRRGERGASASGQRAGRLRGRNRSGGGGKTVTASRAHLFRRLPAGRGRSAAESDSKATAVVVVARKGGSLSVSDATAAQVGDASSSGDGTDRCGRCGSDTDG